MSSEEPHDVWLNFLNPLGMKQKLTKASLFIAAYEMFADDTVERLKAFFSTTWEAEKGWQESERYQSNLRNLDPLLGAPPVRPSNAPPERLPLRGPGLTSTRN